MTMLVRLNYLFCILLNPASSPWFEIHSNGRTMAGWRGIHFVRVRTHRLKVERDVDSAVRQMIIIILHCIIPSLVSTRCFNNDHGM